MVRDRNRKIFGSYSQVEITVQQFIDAIRKNGWTQHTDIGGAYILYDGTTPIVKSACAIGQAGLNLHMSPLALGAAFGEWASLALKIEWTQMRDRNLGIIYLNDELKMTCAQIADTLEEAIPVNLRSQIMGTFAREEPIGS